MIRTECPACGRDLYADSVRLIGHIPLDRFGGSVDLRQAIYQYDDVRITCDDGHVYHLEDLEV